MEKEGGGLKWTSSFPPPSHPASRFKLWRKAREVKHQPKDNNSWDRLQRDHHRTSRSSLIGGIEAFRFQTHPSSFVNFIKLSTCQHSSCREGPASHNFFHPTSWALNSLLMETLVLWVSSYRRSPFEVRSPSISTPILTWFRLGLFRFHSSSGYMWSMVNLRSGDWSDRASKSCSPRRCTVYPEFRDGRWPDAN